MSCSPSRVAPDALNVAGEGLEMTLAESSTTTVTRRRMKIAGLAAGILVVGLLSPTGAVAAHSEVSLPGSNFEIDTNANLKVDDAGSLDWANVSETRQADAPSGSGDDSFGNGSKEDTAVPSVVDGSIPPNKSDLLNFGVYLEDTGTARFLHMFWHRVQEPSGTTNMDFEFNQSETISGNGVTPVRTAGDALIQYDLAQGGTNPQLFLSRWVATGAGSQCQASNSTPCWGTRVNLSAAGVATGSINTTAITAGEADGLGAISVRTFGEATVDFDALAGADDCSGFGSAYLKSRSSDSFTAALKDFIAPTATNFDQCGAIEITKTRKHAASGTGDHPQAGVTFTITGGDLPAGGTTVVTDANGKACLDELALGSYTVTETVPAGYASDDAEKPVTVSTASDCGDGNEATVSFSNTPLTDLTVSVSSQVTGGTASNISCTNLTPTPADATPNDFDDTSETVEDLQPGTYTCTVVIDP
jgi:hypothetical protein